MATFPLPKFPIFVIYIRNGLGRNICHGKFVLGCEDVLISILRTRMEAFLLPPPGSNENALVFYQMFNEVDDDLYKIH